MNVTVYIATNEITKTNKDTKSGADDNCKITTVSDVKVDRGRGQSVNGSLIQSQLNINIEVNG